MPGSRKVSQDKFHTKRKLECSSSSADPPQGSLPTHVPIRSVTKRFVDLKFHFAYSTVLATRNAIFAADQAESGQQKPKVNTTFSQTRLVTRPAVRVRKLPAFTAGVYWRSEVRDWQSWHNRDGVQPQASKLSLAAVSAVIFLGWSPSGAGGALWSHSEIHINYIRVLLAAINGFRAFFGPGKNMI